MPEIEEYKVSLTDDDYDGSITYEAHVSPVVNTLSLNDEEHSFDLIVGKEYTVVVYSVNSAGASEGINSSFGE